MNDEWLNDLRRKMEDHTEDVPDGLWKNIRNELFEEAEGKDLVPGFISDDLKAQEKAGGKNTPKTLWYRIGGAAAAVILFFVLGWLIDFNLIKKGNNKPEYVLNRKNKAKEKTHSSGRISGRHEVKTAGDFLVIKYNTAKKQHQVSTQHISETILPALKMEKAGLPNHSVSETQQYAQKENLNHQNNQILSPESDEIGEKEISDQPGSHELLTKEERELKQKSGESEKKKLARNTNRKPWTLGLLTGNASSGSADRFPGYATLNGTTLSLPEIWSLDYGEDPLLSILLANQDKKVDAVIRHKTPITFGASILKTFGKKWSIGMGVSYTKLSAELTSGSGDNFISSEQNIHYVGIPVQLNYNVVQKGAFTGYVSGGGAFEKAVSGELKTKYIVNGVIKEVTYEKINEKPVQVSVNTAVGLQLKVIRNIGIYAEPGIGYHFHDNSSLNTIYKEKPLNFNLKFGVRILID